MTYAPDRILPMFRRHLSSRGWTWPSGGRSDIGWPWARLTATTILRLRLGIRGHNQVWKPGEFSYELWRVELRENLTWRNHDYTAIAEGVLRDFNHHRSLTQSDAVKYTAVFADQMVVAQVDEARTWFNRAVRVWVQEALPVGYQVDFLYGEDQRGSNLSRSA